MTHRLASVALGVLGLFAFAGADVAAQTDRSGRRGNATSRESIDTTFRMERGGLVDLELMSGDIIVTGTTGNQVRVRATSERGYVVLRASATLTTLRSEQERNGRNGGRVRYEVSVPAGVRVRMEAHSGSLVARGVDADVAAEVLSGRIELSDIGGMSSIEALSGPIMATGLRGGVHIESTSGSIGLANVDGEVLIESTSGVITLDDIRSRRVRVENVSGTVRFQGALEAAGRYEFESHSGGIHLMLPAQTSAQLAVSTFSGSIESEFPITLEPRARSSEKRLEFRLGSGGARVSAETFSGSITITRGTRRERQE